MKQGRKPSIRLYLPADFAAGQALALDAPQSHYLAHVMRCREGDAITVFNGIEGEWQAELTEVAKKSVTLRLKERVAEQTPCPDVWLAFAPIKNKTDSVVEKAVELGVSGILPVITQHAVVKSVNEKKLAGHAIEAAEQCGRHEVPPITVYKDMGTMVSNWPPERLLLYGDETGGGTALKLLLPALASQAPKPLAVLIGPEGGFSADEHRLLKATPFAAPFSLGPRILRADTAAAAALACVQAWLGDWEKPSHWESQS